MPDVDKGTGYASMADALRDSKLFDSPVRALPNVRHGGPMHTQRTRFQIRRNRHLVSSAYHDKYNSLTMPFCGNSKASFLPRLLLIWVVLLPALLIRTLISVLVLCCSLGGLWVVTWVGVSAIPVTVYHTYRPTLLALQDSYDFQTGWDFFASFLSYFINIVVFTIRLLVEILNGFCPWLALFVDLLYEVTRQLVVVVLNVPIIHYIFFFFVRLFVFTLEVLLDCAMQIMAAFGQLMEDLTVGLATVMAAESEEVFGRRSEEFYVPAGEVLLFLCVVMISFIARLLTAVTVALMPMVSSFLLTVLPMVLKYIPPIFEVVVKLFSILGSAPMRRIFALILDLVPIIIEVTKAFVCSLLVYGGATFCYVTYMTTVVLSWVMKWIIRPVSCSGFAILAGCFRNYIYAAMKKDKCYHCGRYSMSCGCMKDYYPSNPHDCDSTCSGPSGLVPIPPPPSPPTGIRNYTNTDMAGDRSYVFITSETTLDGQYEEYGSGTDEQPELETDSVAASVQKNGDAWAGAEAPYNFAGLSEVSAETTYSLPEPDTRRRRSLDGPSTAATRPPVSGPTVAPTAAPSMAPTVYTPHGPQTVYYGSTQPVVVSNQGVYTSSPGMYAALYVQLTPESTFFRMGTLAHRSEFGIQCVGGVECDGSSNAAALQGLVGMSPFAANNSVDHTWVFSELSVTDMFWMRIDLKVPSNTTQASVRWKSISGVVMGPPAYTVIQEHVDGSTTETEHTASCVLVDNDRTDTVSLSGSDVVAVRLEFNSSSSCAGLYYHTSLFHLQAFTVSGYLHSEYQTSHLRETHGLMARTSVWSDRVSVWDPCASGRPQRVFDGRREFPSLFWPTDPLHTDTSVGIQLQMYTEQGTTDVYMSSVLVHLAAANFLSADSVRLCTEEVSSWAQALNHSSCTAAEETHAVTAPSASRLANFRSIYSNFTAAAKADGWIDAPFFDTDYVEGEPSMHRGSHLRFLVNRTTVNSTAVLWLGPEAMNHNRATTWETLLLETGLHPTHYSAAQFLYDVYASLNPDGRTSDPELLNTVWCQEDLTDIVAGLPDPPHTNMSAYGLSFGSSSALRRWVGILEVDVIGTVLQAPQGRRSAPGHGSREAKIADLEQDHIEAAAPKRSAFTVAEVMRTRGLATFKFGTSDSMNGHEIRRLQRIGAVEAVGHHPFHRDLRQMPDPSEEAQFQCREEQGHLKCSLRDMGLLGSPVTNQTSEEQVTQRNSSVFNNMLAVRSSISRYHVSRQLLGSGGGVVGAVGGGIASAASATGDWFEGADVWNQVKDKVDELARKLIREMEKGVSELLQCSRYCDDCNLELKRCLPAFVEFAVKRMFQCSDDDSIYDCTIGRLIDWVLKLLETLLDYLLRFVDLMGEGLGRTLGIGNVLQIIACVSCSLTTIITGVLADFLDNFSLSTCTDIVDTGSTQCRKWDMDGAEEIGAAIFGNIFPVMKIFFGMVQVLPALLDILIEFAILLFSTGFDLFPHLLSDTYVILMWFQSSSGVVGTIETIFEAVGPLMEDAKAQAMEVANTESFGQMSDSAVWADNDDPDGMGAVYRRDTIGEIECLQATSSTEGVCGTRFASDDTATRDSLVANLTSLGGQDIGASSAMEFDLGDCSCVLERQSCHDGAGTGNCPYKNSDAAVARGARQTAADVQAATGGEDPETWPECDNVPKSNLDFDYSSAYAGDSGEIQRVPVPSKKCVLRMRQTTATGGKYNDMALTTMRDKARGITQHKWWPFETFSNEDGSITSRTDSDFFVSQFPQSALHDPGLSETFRRRQGSRRILHQRAAMGVLEFFDDHTTEENEHARQAVWEMLQRRNETYAHFQAMELRKILQDSARDMKKALAEGQLPSTRHVELMGRHLMARGRQLLGVGFSGAEFSDLTCGFKDDSDHPPNTYPCAKHLWCAVPPLIPRSFRFQKRWVAWKESWVENTKCPEMDTYGKWFVYSIRATAKIMRMFTNLLIRVWPWSEIVDSFWRFATFPDDEWPNVKRHGAALGGTYEGLCIVMNIGPLFVFLWLLFMFILTMPSFIVAGRCSGIVYDEVFNSYTDQDLEVERTKRERRAVTHLDLENESESTQY
jgi:hypothetical protein